MVKEGKIADLPPWIEVAKAREKRKWGRYDSDEDEDQEPRNASQDEDNSQHPRKSPKQSATDDATGSFRSPKSPKGKGAEKRADNEDADYDTDHEGDVMGDSD